MEQKKQTYHCSECKAEIHRGEVFCPGCGKKLENYDFEE
ncbi:MAG: zinc-ribbon domain-containing protein [Prevotellaceae bacterium]|nr:zinc-ribbon domain-containing protein [Candidatus Colivivens caballi]